MCGEPSIVAHVLNFFDNLMQIAFHKSENNLIEITTGSPFVRDAIGVTREFRLFAAGRRVE